MPILDVKCTSAFCGVEQLDILVRRSGDQWDLPVCKVCGTPTQRMELQLRRPVNSPLGDYANLSSVRFHFNYQDD